MNIPSSLVDNPKGNVCNIFIMPGSLTSISKKSQICLKNDHFLNRRLKSKYAVFPVQLHCWRLRVSSLSTSVVAVLCLPFGFVARKLTCRSDNHNHTGESARFRAAVSSSCRLLSRSEEGSQGRSELFCSSRSSIGAQRRPFTASAAEAPVSLLLGL